MITDKLLAGLPRVRQNGINRWTAGCPICKSRNGRPISVRVSPNGRTLLHAFCGCATVAVLRSIGLQFSGLFSQHPKAIKIERTLADWSAKAETIWRRTRGLHGTLGEVYLLQRGCALPPGDSDLRYLPPSGHFPPMLCALVTDAITANPISLHFTKLSADGRGKAGTERDKTLLAGHRKGGGIIRLYPNEAVTYGLGIAEGIETALCAAHGFAPLWAAIDAGNLAALPVLAGIEALTIFADYDDAGLRAAKICADRWATMAEVTTVRPDVPGTDIADVVAA